MIARGRLLPASSARALNSALSRGPGYELTPRGTAFDDHGVRGYYIDFRAKTTAPYIGRLDVLPATPLIQLALGWWERHVAGERGALARFLELCRAMEARAERAGDALLWPGFVAAPKYRVVPPAISALPQGQAASTFVRAHLATGEDRYAELALAAVRPLLAPGGSQLVTATATGPILEEGASVPPSHILNGWITALWGVWDVQLALGDARAAEVFAASVSCLRHHMPAYDTGWWTLYSLFPHAIQDLAKPIYHRFHVAQLEVMHRLTGEEEFAEAARRWRSYDRPAHVALALAQKAAFSALDGRRRRRWAADQPTVRRAAAAADGSRRGARSPRASSPRRRPRD